MEKNKRHPSAESRLKKELFITEDFCCNEDFQFEKPVWDKEKCIKCGVCYLFCPDGAIRQDSEGYYEADLTYCKGCGLCSIQCWTHCITMEEASKRFPWLTKF